MVHLTGPNIRGLSRPGCSRIDNATVSPIPQDVVHAAWCRGLFVEAINRSIPAWPRTCSFGGLYGGPECLQDLRPILAPRIKVGRPFRADPGQGLIYLGGLVL